MKRNVGYLDAMIRAFLSVFVFYLLSKYLTDKAATAVLCSLAIYLVLTAAFRFCLVYKILRFQTN